MLNIIMSVAKSDSVVEEFVWEKVSSWITVDIYSLKDRAILIDSIMNADME